MVSSLLKSLPLVALLAAGVGIPQLTAPPAQASPDDVESMIAAPLPREVKPEVAATVRTLTASPQV